MLEVCVCVLALADKKLLEALDSLLKTLKSPTFPEQLQSFLKSKGFETIRQQEQVAGLLEEEKLKLYAMLHSWT